MLSETAPFYSDSNSQRTDDGGGMGTVPTDGPEQPPLLAGDYLVAQPKKVRERDRQTDIQTETEGQRRDK